MPYVTNRGERIHYSVDGTGPLVVLQHGFLSDSQSWKAAGFVDALADRFQVACVDSLGHGQSDKPADPDLYVQEQRAGDLVAVIDDLGCERAHVIGYSMGGWITVGVAKHHPKRLASLTVAGWDVVNGAATARPVGFEGELTFGAVLGGLRASAPMLVEWVTPDVEPGLRACWNELGNLDASEQAVLAAGVPTLFWIGKDDPYHDPMEEFAAVHQIEFLTTPGDHLTAILLHGAEAAGGLRTFLLKQKTN